jgi:hypothetical protein
VTTNRNITPCDINKLQPLSLNTYSPHIFEMAGFPGGMPAMTGMGGGNGAMMDEEAMKQQMIIKYVRMHLLQSLSRNAH